MISYAWYSLQVIICSGIMMIYYWIALRNKRFNKYNRFYILASVFLSFLIPAIKIQLENKASQRGVGHLIYVFADYNANIEKVIANKGFQVNWYMVSMGVYLLVGIVLLVIFLMAIVKIYRLLQNSPVTSMGNISLILTNEAGTPFTFFRYIFWNNEIDIQSVTGQQILQHELIHVKEKHSIDTVLMQLVLMIGWINPIFWLAKKELQLIHEFTADHESIKNGDTASFAAMLLLTAFPRQQYLLTHPFFFSPVKRRLLMLTTNKNPRCSYTRRLIALPLIALVVILFAFRAEHHKTNSSSLNLSKIVNSGHLSDTLIIRDSTGVVKIEKAKVSIVHNSMGGQDTIITILKGNGAQRNFDLNKTVIMERGITSKSSKPLYIVDGKIQKNGAKDFNDMNPSEIESISVLKGISATSKYGEAGKNGVILIIKKPDPSKTLYIIDGKISDKESIDIKQLDLKSVDVLKGDSAISLYGERGKNGVIIITTKKG